MTWIAEIKAIMPTIARYIIVSFIAYDFIQNILHHGEVESEKKYNGWVALISMWLTISLLRIGGFFG